ncbi:LysR family transcriptional regulator [Alphaproteobacteria bacterium GH1-50]|uniref:LysR family transcriptional regulator n=1 Tax=Kangsaoukella pontilimi TaxID=2691042 RepID=A0A7C9MPI0_9RHOB|nr:LysR family transcriptional regulator [Kangsaoukella pontilimi]MXQ06497.1 LysR family transcriptional regulator [Kangsaoukella pontilimi]
MPRNLDLTALRAFVAVADMGGVTRAATMLNLTQSAVSMQLKRLEESLALPLLDRSGRTIGLTPSGERLLGYARRMLKLNDDVFAEMTDSGFEGVLTIGVPHDIVYPAIPRVLKSFAADFPRMRVQLLSSWTLRLKELFDEGRCDMILTTEDHVDPGGETLCEKRMLWYGAPAGTAWQKRPLPLASEPHCQFRKTMHKSLDAAGIAWEMAVDSDSTRTVEATVAADFAIIAQIEGTASPQLEEVPHGGALPQMGLKLINLYVSNVGSDPVRDSLADIVRGAYGAPRLALTG